MNLHVVLRVHDRGNVHAAGRITDPAPKSEVVLRCLKSLRAALGQLEGSVLWTVSVINDDVSKPVLDAILRWGWEVFDLDGTGNNTSMLAAFTKARESTADLVYLVEDDFLHHPSALVEMIQAWTLVKRQGVVYPVIYPYDDPLNYLPQHNGPTLVVPGGICHWRANTYTTATVLCSPDLFRNYWHLWERLATMYEKDNGQTHEGTTINRIWQSRVVKLMTPLPSLAVHLNEHEPFVVDWRALWEHFADGDPA